MEADDHVLARRAAEGDSLAFTALVRRHERKVRAFLSRLTQGRDSDDLAQEVFVKAWRLAGEWRGDGSYGGWLMRIAWTSFLSAHRAETRRQGRDHHAYERSEDAVPDPNSRIDAQRALAGLDERERGAALLCFAEGYSHAEAAKIMDIPLGTLKTIIARARAKLVTALED
ncbi:MAG TPA: RNA polymerase sigma factor [Allosphingosinicella sp.]